MKPSLRSRLEQPNFAVSIRAVCLSLGAQDVTARPWNTSTKSHSPPAGRFVHRHTGLLGRERGWLAQVRLLFHLDPELTHYITAKEFVIRGAARRQAMRRFDDLHAVPQGP